MSGFTVSVVLFAALLHASWNALVKAGPDKFLTTLLVASGAAIISALLLPFLAAPHIQSWPWLAASTCCQIAYYLLLAAAYEHGDMSQAYPLMRGTAPLLVAFASVPLLGERLATQQYVAVALISAGVLAMCFARRNSTQAASSGASRRATGFALLNATAIASYTMIDGVGVRRSGAPAAYTMWLCVLTAIGLLACAAGRRRILLPYARQHWRVALFGGFGSLASYGLALWAMTSAPVAAVAALRETAILFAAVIATLFLRERIGLGRLAAVGLIACGAAVMRFA
ncbi:EamA family transporter [Undibacterium sp.]|jgi:drug/metabolite transporter (DMT)-like permease|uniref:EamA family transporter n=1 Tax=Undibacterium sp. TaxID=1914977 RepID=UPI002B5B5C04|nr:EamA family transporter [Undibacterium sp.]HTD04230.1 EamA family transporter [Undibacterium sp.]